jgi:hypothetical protein
VILEFEDSVLEWFIGKGGGEENTDMDREGKILCTDRRL